MSQNSSVNEDEVPAKEEPVNSSNFAVQNLESGPDVDEKFKQTEELWMAKLSSIDDEHTKKFGLEVKEAEKLIRNIGKYVNVKTERSCPAESRKVTDCLKSNKGNTLSCEGETENYKNCIDKLLHDAVRKDENSIRKIGKKQSYLEKFEREFGIQ